MLGDLAEYFLKIGRFGGLPADARLPVSSAGANSAGPAGNARIWAV